MYCINNPVGFTDPSGRVIVSALVVAAKAAAAAAAKINTAALATSAVTVGTGAAIIAHDVHSRSNAPGSAAAGGGVSSGVSVGSVISSTTTSTTTWSSHVWNPGVVLGVLNSPARGQQRTATAYDGLS